MNFYRSVEISDMYPLETAPRDDQILIGCVGSDDMRVAYWEPEEELWVIFEPEEVWDKAKGKWMPMLWHDTATDENVIGWLPMPDFDDPYRKPKVVWRPLSDEE